MRPEDLPTTDVTLVEGHPIEYRIRRGSGPTLVVLPGAHMSAGTRFNAHRFADDHATFMVVSRPGYRRTAADAGPSSPEFAVRLVRLCRQLGLSDITVVGISMGARAALSLAAIAPDLVAKVALLCPVSFAPWPDPRTRRVAQLMFSPATKGLTWGLTHTLLRSRPDVILPTAVAGLTTLAPSEMLRRTGGDLDELVAFLATCSSDRGFRLDLRPPTDVTASVRQPTLILASRSDGSVSFDHPEQLAATLPAAQLVEVDAAGHLLWLGDRARTTKRLLWDFVQAGQRG